MTDPRNRTPRWLHALPVIYLLAGFAWILGSDLVVGWLYRDDVRSLVYANILKGLIFVFLTATLLYVILGVWRADSTAGLRKRESFNLRRPLAAFALAGLGIAAAGYLVYLLEADGIRDRAEKQLQASVQRSVAEFSAWHDGRVRSILQIADNQLTLRSLKQWQHSPSDPQRELLREHLEFIRVSQGYTAVAAFTQGGATLMAVGRPIVVTAEVRRSMRDAVAVGRVVSSWITIDGAHRGRQPAVDLVVPLYERHGVDGRPVALIIARAAVTLPLSAVPTSAAAQNLNVALARPDGAQIGMLQRSSNSGLVGYTLLPRMRNDLAVVRVVLGERGAVTALDTDDRKVVATGYPVGATPWIAIAAIDLASIEQQIQRLILLIACMSALGFLATAGLVLPWWRLFAGAGAQIKEAESRAEEMAARLGWVTRYANDVILLLDLDGKILDANDRAEELYGYSRAELLALSFIDLRQACPSQVALAHAQLQTVKRDGSLVYEAIHVDRRGSQIPVETSSRQVTYGNRRYIQSIVRDISERRRTEEKLRQSEAQYRRLFRASPYVMWVFEIESLRFLAVNDAAIEHYGYTEPEFLKMTIADIRPQGDRARLVAHLNAPGINDLRHSGIWQHRKKDGTLIDVEITSHGLTFDDRPARLVIAADVTNQLRMERALKASEERYRGLFENASDGILVLGTDQKVIAANAECQGMLGYSRAELVGMGPQALLDECEHVRLPGAAASLLGSRASAPATWIHRRKDGSRFTGETRARMLPGGDVLVTMRNLTEILAARHRIERQRDLFKLLSQCNQAIIRASDTQALLHEVALLAVERGRFLFAWIGENTESGDVVPVVTQGDDGGYVSELHLNLNEPALGAVGPAGKALRSGQPVIVNDFLNDASLARWHEAARARGIGAVAALPILTHGKSTTVLMLYARDVGYFDEEVAAALEDMTADLSHAIDALRTRRELEDGRLLLQSLINATDTLVYAFDLEGRAILMNVACASAMGGTCTQLIGRTRDAVLPREIALAHLANDQRVAESGEQVVVEEWNTVAGVEHVYLSVKYPLKDIDGRVYAVGGISTDITEFRRIQQELAETNQRLEERVAERTREAVEARARAEAADRAKTDFLSSLSHELRSPLHSIIGFTSLLLEGVEGDLTPAQLEHLRVVSDASRHLLALINDLLDMSRIEAGAVALEIRKFAVNRSLQRVMERFSLQAREKDLDLRLETPEVDHRIMGDERRIEQIVSNLVANAIKYTVAGAVTVSCSHEVDGVLRIDVRDTGPGIALEDQQRLFSRFTQLKPTDGSLAEGTGLGLAIASGLAEVMGGEMLLQSAPGAGSVFSLVLPTQITGDEQ